MRASPYGACAIKVLKQYKEMGDHKRRGVKLDKIPAKFTRIMLRKSSSLSNTFE